MIALPLVENEATDATPALEEIATVEVPASYTQPFSQLSPEERASIFQAAQHGNAEALRRVLWSMAIEPERGVKILDVPTQIRRNMTSATHPGNELIAKTTHAQCEMVRADLLASCGGTAIERLLIDRIVTCWLAAYLADGTEAVASKYAGRDSEYHLRRQDRAHKRLLQSIEALARVQRLMRPGPLVAMAQLNIAQPGSQQVNTAQAGWWGVLDGTPE